MDMKYKYTYMYRETFFMFMFRYFCLDIFFLYKYTNKLKPNYNI